MDGKVKLPVKRARQSGIIRHRVQPTWHSGCSLTWSAARLGERRRNAPASATAADRQWRAGLAGVVLNPLRGRALSEGQRRGRGAGSGNDAHE